ncbi:DNA polymerase delta, subunit 4-domain-containing protein [Mycena filopes]|nr:DNA polymerase delta, subunit 4-domain-containing protein [Mycena filopes]
MPKAAKSSSLTQSTLSFGASKRTASSGTSTKKSAPPRRASSLSSQQPITVDSDDDIDVDVDDIEVSDDEDDEVEIIEDGSEVEEKRAPQQVAVKKAMNVVKVTRPRTSPVKPPPTEAVLELNAKDPRWSAHLKEARTRRGYLKLIHAEDQDKFHDILRVFDLSYEYGPCDGVSRLERWERASALGLSPPVEVHDILTTRQGKESSSYAQSVLYGLV